jgi:lipoate-protein ligase B
VNLLTNVTCPHRIPYNEVLEPSDELTLVQRAGDQSAYQTAAIAAAFSMATAASISVCVERVCSHCHIALNVQPNLEHLCFTVE